MEVKLVRMQAKYREDGRFQSHGLTSWPRISEILTIYPRWRKMEALIG
jgi:hypothetical protein